MCQNVQNVSQGQPFVKDTEKNQPKTYIFHI